MDLVPALIRAGRIPREVVRKRIRTVGRQLRTLEKRWLPERAIRREETKLKQSWERFSEEALEAYLVSGYQNPRINAQSILARHFFIRQCFGAEFDGLMREELEFCVETNEAIRQRAAELGVRMGAFTDPGRRAEVERACAVIADRERLFEERWRDTLAGRSAESVSVLEFACGSANDYRSLEQYGIARFLDYTGVDLNEKNIANARKLYPGVAFEVSSILNLRYDDAAFDYVLAFDIFEHLSLVAMERAVDEAMRLAKKGLVLTFFIMTDAPEHNERPKRHYHWNELSAPRMEKRIGERFADVEVTHIPTFLKREFNYRRFYNKKAYTITAQHPR